MKDYKKILLVVLILGITLLIVDYKSTQTGFDGKITRNAAGLGTVKDSLIANFNENSQEIQVEVSEKRLTHKEVEAAFNKAIQEIDATYLGENKSANEVSSNLDLKRVYADGLIDVEWVYDKYGYIDSSGKIQTDKIPKEGQLITITADMKYEDQEQLYSFCVFVTQKGLDSLDGQVEAIERQIKESDESTRSENKLVLPTNVDGMKVSWRKKMDYRGLEIIILGILCIAGLKLGKSKDAKKQKESIANEMNIDYPMIINELSILMGAGMSFRKALERIVVKYSGNVKAGKSPKRPGFEQMLQVYRRMSDGLSEIQAIEELGAKCESKEYRKLSMLLSQNLRKGSKDLIDCLEKEQASAFEARKQRAIRAGEEASTKLLIPMGGMLFIVIIILVVPAMMQINI